MKNKKVRRMALGMALAMTAVSVAGCGNTPAESSSVSESSSQESQTESAGTESGQESEAQESTAQVGTDEEVALKWVLRIAEQTDQDEVLAAVSDILKKDINATLEIEYIDPAAYPDKTKLKIASNEVFDLMFTSAGYQYQDYATKGAFLELEDLLPVYAPKTWEMIPEGFWEAVKVNGHIYGIPNYQIAARSTTVTVRDELAEKYDIDLTGVKTVEDMEPILALLKEKEPDKKYILGGTSMTYYDTMNYLGLEAIGALDTPGCIEIDGDSYTVINQYEYPAFVELAKTVKSFADKGYLDPDLSLVQDQTELKKNGEILAEVLGNYKPGGAAEMEARNGYLSREQVITEPYVSTSSILGTLTAVSATSLNPERALMLVDEVNFNPDVYNTIVYGIEGKHYNKIDDNTIELIPDSGYTTNVPWMVGNTFNGYLKAGQDAGIYDETKKMNEESKVSRIMGFTFNQEPVKAEISQCKTVTDKYVIGLGYGMFDVDETLATMNEELKAAGMDKIIAEMQKQLDAWVAANK